MQEPRLANEILARYKFPNLIAEVVESGYGLHTIADFMGYREYDEEVIRTKLITGDITASEAFGLAKYYNVDVEYMFSEVLVLENGKPKAYWCWLKEHNKREQFRKRCEEIRAIEQELKEKPYLISFLKQCIGLTEEERAKVLEYIQRISMTKE